MSGASDWADRQTLKSESSLLLTGLGGIALAAAVWPFSFLGLLTFLILPLALGFLGVAISRSRVSEVTRSEALFGLTVAMLAAVALGYASIRAVEFSAASQWRQSHPGATFPPLASAGDWQRVGILVFASAVAFSFGVWFRGRFSPSRAVVLVGMAVSVVPAALLMFNLVSSFWFLGN